MNNAITLHTVKDEARVTSFAMAEHLGIQHKNVLEMIDKYRSDFEELAPLAFQTRKGEALPQGGFAKSTRIALLNEDQAYLLLTFTRNTRQVRGLKVELVKAFSRFRQHRQPIWITCLSTTTCTTRLKPLPTKPGKQAAPRLNGFFMSTSTG